MDRQFVYAGQIPLETDILSTNQNVYIALGKLAATLFGTGQAVVNGFGCIPTAPASMSINVAAGEIYSQQNIDSSNYSALSADTTHQIMKQGLLLDGQTISLTAPTTTGQSVAYLVQVAFQELDSGAKVLQYYNSSNPAQSYSGVSNSGQAQPTVRQNTCVISVKAGVPANTGSQATPTPDIGYIGLWVVTVANGQTTIQSQHITQYLSAPFINTGLLGLSPNFNVSPTAPTPEQGDTSNKVATMSALQNALYQGKGSQLFITSGTFTVPAGVNKIYVSAVGGGAGGGGGAGTNGDTAYFGGGGGAGGGAGQSILNAAYSVIPGDAISITIGAGGGGGTGGIAGVGGNVGGGGGDTIIGSFATAKGAPLTFGGGVQMSSGNAGSGALRNGGYPAGSSGTDGALAGNGGAGASSMYGGGGGAGRGSLSVNSSQTGDDAAGYGAGGGGGGGGYGKNAVAGGNGGNGTSGMVLIGW